MLHLKFVCKKDVVAFLATETVYILSFLREPERGWEKPFCNYAFSQQAFALLVDPNLTFGGVSTKRALAKLHYHIWTVFNTAVVLQQFAQSPKATIPWIERFTSEAEYFP